MPLPAEMTAEKSICRPCPVCSEPGHLPFLAKDGIRLARCVRCGMVYMPELGRAYADGSFYEMEAAPFYLSEDKLRGDFSPTRYVREVRLLRKWVQAGSILDVGCSTGGFLWQLSQRFPGAYRPSGMDVPSAATRHAQSLGLEIIPGDFLQLDSPDQFDAITFWAVLEHVADPGSFLRQALRLLKPGGVCIVLVPNIGSLAVKILGERYRYILPQHLNYFSCATLRQLVATSGLRVLDSMTTHFNPVVIWKDYRSKTGLAPDRERARLLAKTNAWKENPFLAPLRAAYAIAEKLLASFDLADNAVVVARKP